MVYTVKYYSWRLLPFMRSWFTPFGVLYLNRQVNTPVLTSGLYYYVNITSVSLFLQVSRAAVEGYTGEGEPPCSCIVVTPKEQPNNNLYLDVQFHNGTILSSTTKIKIFRMTEQSIKNRLLGPSQGNLMHQNRSFHRYRYPYIYTCKLPCTR